MEPSAALAGTLLAPTAVVLALLVFVYRGRSELAGALSGFPTVTALVTAIAGASLGSESVQATSTGIQFGLMGTSTFLVVYRISMGLRPVAATGRAFLGYFVALCLVSMPLVSGWFVSAAVVSAAIALTVLAGTRPVPGPVGRGRSVVQVILPLTASLALSAASKLVGPHTAGLLTPFPSTIFPLVYLTHLRRPHELPRVIAGAGRGLVGTLAFAISLRSLSGAGVGSAWWIALVIASGVVVAATTIARTCENAISSDTFR